MPVFIEGVPPAELNDDELFQELVQLYRTRYDTLRHGSDHALLHHNQRMTELEAEYMRRYPQREVDPHRTREGAQQVQPRS